MQISYFISVFLHIVCASFWLGGMLFLPLVVLPGIKNNPSKTEILFDTGIKFRFYGWIALIILVITGIFNFYSRGIPFTIDFFIRSSYGILFLHKLVLFVIVLVLSIAHDFFIGASSMEKMKQNASAKNQRMARWSGRIMLLFSLAIAFVGVILSRGGI